jgi:hypothetical protein
MQTIWQDWPTSAGGTALFLVCVYSTYLTNSRGTKCWVALTTYLGGNVKITISGDFHDFRRKDCRFSWKLMLWWINFLHNLSIFWVNMSIFAICSTKLFWKSHQWPYAGIKQWNFSKLPSLSAKLTQAVRDLRQVCQMVYFKNQKSQFGYILEGLICNGNCWNIL